MEYRYHIKQFVWDKIKNEFFAEAMFLHCVLSDGNIHHEAFPNMKGQFFIDNPETGGFRRFRFIKEDKIMDGENYLYTEWIFESEDNIKCRIAID